jgi:hypothetical protein
MIAHQIDIAFWGSHHVLLVLGVFGVDDLVLIKFNLDPLPICAAFFIGVGD